MQPEDPTSFARLTAESLHFLAFLASRAFDDAARARLGEGLGVAVGASADVLRAFAAKSLPAEACAPVDAALEALGRTAEETARPVDEIRAAARAVLDAFGFGLPEAPAKE